MRDLSSKFKVFSLQMFLSGFITHGIKKGSGFRSLVVLTQVLFLLKVFFNERMPALLLYDLLDRLRPRISFRISKFKPNISYTPFILTTERSFKLCFRWIFKFSNERIGFTRPLKLFLELVDNLLGKGKTMTARDEIHLLAFSYLKNLRNQQQISLDVIDNLQISENSKELIGELQELQEEEEEGFTDATWDEDDFDEYFDEDFDEDEYEEDEEEFEEDDGEKKSIPKNLFESIQEDDWFYQDEEDDFPIPDPMDEVIRDGIDEVIWDSIDEELDKRTEDWLDEEEEKRNVLNGSTKYGSVKNSVSRKLLDLEDILIFDLRVAVMRQLFSDPMLSFFFGHPSKMAKDFANLYVHYLMHGFPPYEEEFDEDLDSQELPEDHPIFDIEELERRGLPVEPTDVYSVELPEELSDSEKVLLYEDPRPYRARGFVIDWKKPGYICKRYVYMRRTDTQRLRHSFIRHWKYCTGRSKRKS